MGKAVNEVLNYSGEDSVEIHKHWIIFVNIAITIIIESVILYFIFGKWGYLLGRLFEDSSSSLLRSDAFPTLVVNIWVGLNATIKFIRTYITYTTVRLQANNTFIKGKTGNVDVGIITASLDKIISISLHIPLFGRLFHYGDIKISINGYNEFAMDYMVNIEKFQEAVLLLQEAQIEGRNIRQAERQGDIQRDIVREQTAAQTEAMASLGQNIGIGIAQSITEGLEQKKVQSIEQKNDAISIPEIEMKKENE